MACEFVWADLGGFRRIKMESRNGERPNLGLAKAEIGDRGSAKPDCLANIQAVSVAPRAAD
jgi:hypothetical protein